MGGTIITDENNAGLFVLSQFVKISVHSQFAKMPITPKLLGMF